MRKLMIDDEPELKAIENGYDLEEFQIAETLEDGIKFLEENEYDILYLDYKLSHGKTGNDVLNWLAEHLDRVPPKIVFISFCSLDPMFQPKIDALLATAKRKVTSNE